MEKYKSVYSSKEFYTIPETIFELNKESSNTDNNEEVIGGISSDTKHSWLALGPYLQVFYTKAAKVRSVWCFGTLAKEPNAKIICIEELKVPYQEGTLLVVGLQYGSHTGMVCIYNLSCAKVLRAIEIPQHVTSVHVVNPGNDAPFPGPLSALDGILAVGTVGGAVYLVDLCREIISESRKLSNVTDIRNESHPCQLRLISRADVHELDAHKTAAEQDGTHVAILLNANEVSGMHFELKTPEGRNVILASKKEVDVSTLQYAPQLCSLFVGYNFGALQIWNVLSLGLDYTSPVYEENLPVSFVAIQEPIDDPRAFCYFWAVYSYTDQYQNAFPLAALYALNYESKDYHEGYGNVYRGLTGCSVRFQANLRMVDAYHCSSTIGANCIKLQSYAKVGSASGDVLTSPNDDHALCMMVWNIRCEEHKFHTYLSLFDLNQWYKEQMPNVAYQQHYLNFMTHLCLTDGNAPKNYPILDAQIEPLSIDPYVGVTRLEEHYRPSSLAFNLVILTEIEVSRQSNLGAQRGLFKDLEESGPLALMHPEDYYDAARVLGLAPLFQDMPSNPPTNVQCDVLLSIALERKMLKWLCKCATSWGNGSHRSVGLSLELLLNWGWERTRVLKANVDKCCACLFDYSGTKLDANVSATITACRVQFGNLKDLFGFVVKHCDTFLVHPEITRQQLAWLQKNYAYFNVIGWMINMRLLPESKATYPVEEISGVYQQRRNYLRSLDPHRSMHDSSDYLYVDQLTNIESLRNEWGGVQSGNLYPPATMQTLLRSYFNETLDVKMAHALIAYAMLDLVMHCEGTRENENISATLIKFPQIFDLSMSATKVIQAFWQFDRGQLEPAISQFVGRTIHPHDINATQHRFVVKVLRLQGQYRLALKYMKARNTKGSKEDVKHLIQLHVRNKMIFEALSIERRHDDDELLEAFFFECLQADVLMQMVSFNFTKNEELALLKFMDKWSYPKKEEFKTVYFVRRGRFLDFYMRHDKAATQRQALPYVVKNTLDSILPAVTKQVINTCLDLKDQTYDGAKSLSAYVCNPTERAKFNNNFVKACVVNCKQAWKSNDELTEEDFPFVRPPCVRNAPQSKNIIYTRSVAKLAPRVRQQEEAEDDRPEPPSKRMRLDLSRDEELMNMTTIDTYFHRSQAPQTPANATLSMATPMSILKTTAHSQRGESTTPEDLNDLRRSMTPKLVGRPSVTTSVRFTGLSSKDSFNNSFSLQSAAIGSSTSNANTKESTTTDYFSAEASFDHSEDATEPSRKRKFSADEDAENVPFYDVEPSILRSTSATNANANRFLESMRKSYVEEALPEVNPIPSPIATPVFGQAETSYKSVFVFTGADGVDTSGLTPRARDTYQSHGDAGRKNVSLSLHRQAVDCQPTLVEEEFRTESKIITTSTSTHTEILKNGETHTETTTIVHEEGFQDARKEVTLEEITEPGPDGDKSLEQMEIDDFETKRDEEPKKIGNDDGQSVKIAVTPSNSKTGNKTIIDLTKTPGFDASFFNRSGLVDYFTPSKTPDHKNCDKLPVPKVTWSVSLNDEPQDKATQLDVHRRVNLEHLKETEEVPPIEQPTLEPCMKPQKLNLNTSLAGKSLKLPSMSKMPASEPQDSKAGLKENEQLRQAERSTSELSFLHSASISKLPSMSEMGIKPQRLNLNASPKKSGKSLKFPSMSKMPAPEPQDSKAGLKENEQLRQAERSTPELSFLHAASISKLPSMSEMATKMGIKPQRLCLDTTAASKIDNTDELNTPDVILGEPETPRGQDKTIPIIELVDTPVIAKSFYERPSFVDYFADSYTEDEELKLRVSTSPQEEDAVQIVDVSDEVQAVEDNPSSSSNEGAVVIEQPAEPEVNIYEDLSNPASGTPRYIIDSVMNNYNQPQEADYQGGLVLAAEPPAENSSDQTAGLNMTFTSEAVPREELFESMDAVGESEEDTRAELNNAVDEIISIGSSSDDRSDTEKTGSRSVSRTSSYNQLSTSEAADVAFIADNDSTSVENLDENVNEVKTSSKSESDTIVTESSVDVVKEGVAKTGNGAEDMTKVKKVEEIVQAAEEDPAPSTPRRRTRRSSSTKSDPPTLTIQLRPRRNSMSSDTQTATPTTDTTVATEAPVPKVAKAVLRTRSMSTDSPSTPPKAAPARRSMRARSVDVVALNPIPEEVKPSPRRVSRRLSELREAKESQSPKTPEPASTPEADLLTARRLTRNQKQLMNERTIDRLQLLDKDDFQGTSDPEETNLLQRSPPSSIASSSAAENAKLLDKEASTPKKRGRAKKTPTPEPTATAAGTASGDEGSVKETGRSTRAGSADSGSRTPRRTTRKMSVITEEADTEVESTVAKRGRRRSSAAQLNK